MLAEKVTVPGKHWRPKWHFAPQQNWINDPNGLFYFAGQYHLCFQYNPFGEQWGNMHWGHAVSEDLLTWRELDMAIAAEPQGLGYIFSGGAVIDVDNQTGLHPDGDAVILATYTHHSNDEVQCQSLALSLDGGQHFTPYADNPIIANPGIKDFRDPNAFWHAPSRLWIMALAAGDHIQFHASSNFIDWHYLSAFGSNCGAHGGVWECPDLFPLTCAETGEIRWILLVSINPGGPNGGSATQYFVGDFDGRHFTAEHDDIRWLDLGTDCYAGMTFKQSEQPTDKRLFIAWMNNWNYANQTPTEGWTGAMTLPRYLRLHRLGDDWRVAQEAVPTGGQAGGQAGGQTGGQNSQALTPQSHDVLVAQEALALCQQGFSGTVDIHLTLQATPCARYQIGFYSSLGERLAITVDLSLRQLLVDRSFAGWQHPEFVPVITLPLPKLWNGEASCQGQSDSLQQLRLVLDNCSLECFYADGLLAATTLVFSMAPFEEAVLTCESGTLQNIVCTGHD